MTDPRLDFSLEGPVARLVIRRSDKLNALDAAMVESLLPICRQVERSSARVLILSGEGEKAFSAGGDIAAWGAKVPEDFGRHWLRNGHDAFDALARLAIPVIAVLNGPALGGGLELAACADFRLAEAHVRIGLPETSLGIIPGWSGTQRAIRRFGAQVVRRMALFGEVFDVEQALALGLVDAVVPTGQGAEEAQRVAERLLARSGRATELCKMLINAAEGEERERVLESLAGALAAGSTELQEGLAAFREKRAPRFASGEAP
ncbi:enoyl-CoA hydratase/isomerase family protein [Rubellimicrobium roseum]|uniref:Enoyl-CoA hydratase/isomerase family protein n=1 Tax=Rubellimicrobium roseum TaxID=687525 RepID=A0A5C4NF28_9RHOB|nr:enoyl-CoA hydratase/isomerase family protein [Rubellimicrobium roseum]TNC72772.1 enoyl-CoA hydratase/isomerase family protein [Rubellimicrobium roseum]